MKVGRLASILGVLLVLIVHENRSWGAEPARGAYLDLSGARRKSTNGQAGPDELPSRILYLNGCFDGGCTFTPSTIESESSIENQSSVVSESPANIAAFSLGDAKWQELRECLVRTFEPFDIEVTDIDPGNAPHFEAVLAGLAQDIGAPIGAGGFAPFVCGEVIPNAISFTFAENFEGNIDRMCWVAAQEAAHAFGLDHQYLCEDPMTYLESCGNSKRFANVDAPCGESVERDCLCNGNTQNSYQWLQGLFGPGKTSPPTVTITEPANGDRIEGGAIVRVEAVDDFRVDLVSVYLNDELVSSSSIPPYIFNLPKNLASGTSVIRVSAEDNYGDPGSQEIEVLVGSACETGGPCCEGNRCYPDYSCSVLRPGPSRTPTALLILALALVLVVPSGNRS